MADGIFPPPPSDYFAIPPGSERRAAFDFAKDYALPPGECQIKWLNVLGAVMNDREVKESSPDVVRAVTVDCPTVTIQVLPWFFSGATLIYLTSRSHTITDECRTLYPQPTFK